MRLLMCLLLLSSFVSVANAQSAKIDRIEIIGVGLFTKSDQEQVIQDKSISTGQRTVQRAELTMRTNVISIRDGRCSAQR